VQYRLRKATLEDRIEIEALIARSIRALGVTDYSPEQIETALTGAFGVDTQLIHDGTYYVAESCSQIVGCGGWSRRRTLFGGDRHSERDIAELDPAIDAAKIRAFFVDPGHARHGVGTTILRRCELDARDCGFQRLELMATLTGARLYSVHGYISAPAIRYELATHLTIEFVPMKKTLSVD
jgi:N-acetylglutamate synthase-like GNAT family acetyltransferase